jgi:superfamily II DNA helicase RecQ
MNSLQLNEKAIEILKNVFGFSNYRYGQKEIVENILSKNRHLL